MADDKPAINEWKPLKDKTAISKKTGRKLSETHEVKMKNTIYIVTSEYQETGPTVTDILGRVLMRKVESAIRNHEI